MKQLLLSLLILMNWAGINAQTTSEDYSASNIEDFGTSTIDVLGGTTEPKHFPNHFTVTPPEGYVLLNAEESKRFLVDLCENPESTAENVLGCLVPNVEDVFVEGIPYFFAISDEMCGYVKDTDANDINYTELLSEMKKSSKEANEEYRKKHPEYPVVTLVGWAEQPYYDKSTHTLYWGKILDFQQESRTINYDMRVIGKDGFVLIQAVGDETDLEKLKEAGKKMLGNVTFDKGYTYADFDESRDHIAEWTIGGLIVGKVLTKVGFWALIAKGWKFILIAIVAIGAAIKKFFKRKDEDTEEDDSIDG